jgi:hypothetical protein
MDRCHEHPLLRVAGVTTTNLRQNLLQQPLEPLIPLIVPATLCSSLE